MAHTTQLEERIVSLLQRPTHRKAGLAALATTALLVGALVPVLAAVSPTEPPRDTSGSELAEVVAEIRDAERRLEPYLERLEAIEVDIEPDRIAEIEAHIDRAAMADIERRMEPYLERIEEIVAEMEPVHEQIEAMTEHLGEIQLHIDDGTIEDVGRQISEQVEQHMAGLEDLHIELEPLLGELDVVHEAMAELELEMDDLHLALEVPDEAIAALHDSLAPMHEALAAVERDMAPIEREMEGLGERLEEVLRTEVEQVLRDHVGPVVEAEAPLGEAAARVIAEASIRVDDDAVEVDASLGETRRALTDLLASYRRGSPERFDDAVAAAANALAPLRLTID
jgi:predicted  nucleic acid-binding Zn-ribbon protein